jgi:hypothetical protein
MSKSYSCDIWDDVEHVLDLNMRVMHALIEELKILLADSRSSEDTRVRQSSWSKAGVAW